MRGVLFYCTKIGLCKLFCKIIEFFHCYIKNNIDLSLVINRNNMETIKHTQGFVSHNLGLLNDRQRQDLFGYLGDLGEGEEIGVFSNNDASLVGIDKIVMVKMSNGNEVCFRLSMIRVVEIDGKKVK